MNKTFWAILALCAAFAVVGCNKKLEDSDVEETVQAAAEDLASIDEAFTGGSRGEEDEREEDRSGLCFTKLFQPCASGVITRDFDECSRPLSGTTWDGIVKLQFSQSACTFAATNDTITRTFTQDLTITGRRGAVITTTSSNTTTHDGETVGGGQKLTRTGASAFSWETLGINRKGVAGSTELFNITRKTTAPLVITGTGRADRTITSGTMKAFHNIAKFNVEWVYDNVKWDATCICPISGKLTGTLTGTKTGTVVMTANGCGKVTIEKDGKTTSIDTDACEAVSDAR